MWFQFGIWVGSLATVYGLGTLFLHLGWVHAMEDKPTAKCDGADASGGACGGGMC
jgi:hypothetical protein